MGLRARILTLVIVSNPPALAGGCLVFLPIGHGYITYCLNAKEGIMRISLAITILFIFVTSSLLSGCSISHSSGKSSDSISASSESISNSSSNDDEETAESTASTYIEDITVATERFVFNQRESEQFLQTISNIALNHGIVDWEQEKMTYTAMGRGLKRAGVNEQYIAKLAYFSSLVGSDDYSQVLTGYHRS